MNCFHFSVSLRYNTTSAKKALIKCMLWIAFIFLYLWDTTQPFFWRYKRAACCELLSFFCIFEIQHNQVLQHLQYQCVVNCFHFSVSLRYNTTKKPRCVSCKLLWIAFIFLYLWDTTQLQELLINLLFRCELLSFFCIFEIQHNSNKWLSMGRQVVNCFHFSVSLRYNTTI